KRLAVLGGKPLDLDDHAVFDRALLPAAAQQRAGRAHLTRPVHDGAVRTLHVDIDPRVRIRPIRLRDRAFEHDWFVLIEFSRKRVVRADRRGAEHHGETRHGDRSFHVRRSYQLTLVLSLSKDELMVRQAHHERRVEGLTMSGGCYHGTWTRMPLTSVFVISSR